MTRASARGVGHVLVVGAGVGGLAAALDLVSSGLRVTVLERQGVPGGKMRELTVNGRGIDSGPTVLTMRHVFDELFCAAGFRLEDRLTLSRSDILARHSWLDGSRFDLYADPERSAAGIEALAGPRDAAGYIAFARETEKLFTLLDATFMRRERPGLVGLARALGVGGLRGLWSSQPFSSLWTMAGRYFEDPRLRQLFGRYATYCGSSPFAAPATLMLIAHAERSGVWCVQGGMQRLAEALADAATESGAEIRYETPVERIVVRRGQTRGVMLEQDEFIAADAVVFNGDVQALGRGLLGDGVRRAAPRPFAGPRSLSALTWSAVTPASGFPLAYHTVLFGRDYAKEFRELFTEQLMPQSPTIYICSQDLGPGTSSPRDGEGRRFVLVNAPPRNLSDRERDAARRRVSDHLAAHGVHLDLCDPATRETGPEDFDRLFPGSDGALYGWPTHGWSGSFRRHGSRSRIPGLYLAGGSVHPGPGIPMVAISGRLAAASVRQDLVGDLSASGRAQPPGAGSGTT